MTSRPVVRLRPIQDADVAEIVALTALDHQRRHTWSPELWALAAGPTSVHRQRVQELLERSERALLAEVGLEASSYQVVGAVFASPVTRRDEATQVHTDRCGRGDTWQISELVVAEGSSWTQLAGALTSEIARAGSSSGATGLLCHWPTAHRSKGEALGAAGFEQTCWFRHRRLDDLFGTDEYEPGESFDPGLPLPHLHGLSAAALATISVTAPGAHAMVTPRLAPPAVYAGRGTFRLAESVIASTESALWRVLDEVESVARASGDQSLLVAVGPSEEALDELLARRRYERVVDWGLLTLSEAPQR